jgi:hypothetical protein
MAFFTMAAVFHAKREIRTDMMLAIFPNQAVWSLESTPHENCPSLRAKAPALSVEEPTVRCHGVVHLRCYDLEPITREYAERQEWVHHKNQSWRCS